MGIARYYAGIQILDTMDSRYLRILPVLILLVAGACTPTPPPRDARAQDPNSAAGKAGQAAHKAAVSLDKAGRVIGKKLDKAARDAHAGWKEASRTDGSKK